MGQEKVANQQTASDAQATANVFSDTVKVAYAKNFSVNYREYYKIVRTSSTLGDWEQGGETQDLEDVMVLVPEDRLPPLLKGDLAGASVVRIPASNRIATNYPGVEIWLDMLGLKDRIVAIGGRKTYDDDLRNQLNTGQIGSLGYSWATQPDMEVLLECQPSIFLMVLSRLNGSEALEKLRTLGIPVAPIFDWAEKNYLARAEWIKYCALFFNAEAEANVIFNEIEAEVKRLRALAKNIENKPTCLWGHYVDSGFYLAHANNAEARLLQDAGAINPVQDYDLPFNPIGKAFTVEEMLTIGKEADVWIIGSGIPNTPQPSLSYLRGFKAWREGALYHHYQRSKPEYNAFDWFNLAPIRPDYVLADLIAILHPELLPERQPVFFGDFVKPDDYN